MQHFIKFGAKAASEISGVKPALQRDWRRRGFLPEIEGKAQFSLGQVVYLAILNLMASRSIGPQSVHEVCEYTAHVISNLIAHEHAPALIERGLDLDAEYVAKIYTDGIGMVTSNATPSGPTNLKFIVVDAENSVKFTDNIAPLIEGWGTRPYVVIDLLKLASELDESFRKHLDI